MDTYQVRILHISDLHERGPREVEPWRRRRVLGKAWLANLQAIAGDGQVDLVCLTGDVADWGLPEEYEQATSFVEGVLSALGLDRSRLFVVPGNHDIHRGTSEPAWKRLRRKLEAADPLKVSRWMAGHSQKGTGLTEHQRELVQARQQVFRTWLQEIGRGDLVPGASGHPSLGYRHTLRLPGHPFDLHVIGLDSAWLCGDDHDQGRLWLTQDQVGALCTDERGEHLPGFRLALVHHPLDHLVSRDASDAESALGAGVDLLLRGHLHRGKLTLFADTDRRLRQVAAGCLYEGHGGDQYRNGCSLIRATLDERGRPQRYDLWFRSWSEQGHWFDDNSLYRDSQRGRTTWWIEPSPAEASLHPLVAQLFVGRESELASLDEWLMAAPEQRPPVAICAVQGMPGVGKTYLADRFAHEHRNHFPGGMVRLVLDPQSPATVATLLDELRDQLGLPAMGSGIAPVVRERLLQTRTLLHIENVDSEAAAGVAVELTGQLTGCPVLVTGRVRDLGLTAGWRQVVVEPFDEATALEQLRCELGQEPEIIDEQEQRTLVRALGSLPLAIHLAAGHLRGGRSVAGFLQRLHEQGLRIEPAVPGELAASPDRLRAMLDTTFKISLEILGQELGERAEMLDSLCALGHAPLAGFGRSLGAAIAGLGLTDLEDLIVLGRKLSLVLPVPRSERPDGAWRLHPLVAELLRNRADPEPVLDRVTDWFVERLPEGGEDQGERWREIDAESHALDWWLRRVQAEQQARVIRTGSWYARFTGPFHLWAELCRSALENTDGDRSRVLWVLAHVAVRAGNLDEANRTALELIEHASGRNDIRTAAIGWGVIADIMLARGDLDEALRIRQKDVLPAFDELGDIRERAVTLGRIADILQVSGELDEALRIRQEEELPVFDKLGDIRERAVTMGKIADILKARGEHDRALRTWQEDVLPAFDRLGDIRERAVAMGKIAGIMQAQGDLDEAVRIRQEEELPVYEQLSATFELLRGRAHLALYLLQRDKSGDREQAAELLGLALAAAEQMGLPDGDQIRQIIRDKNLDVE
jgi:tetratricopeptide (TPR) repeat protein/predicted phosphodiesterase